MAKGKVFGGNNTNATGDAIVGDVIISKTFSNDSGLGKTGTIPNLAGDTASLSSSIDGTTLKLITDEGYMDGVDDTVTITDADFLAANIKNGVTLFGLLGTYIFTDKLWAWGFNVYGQLGDGGVTTRLLPVLAGDISSSNVTCGFSHVLSIKLDNTLWGWGKNNYGQLGDGTTARNTPSQVGSSTWKMVASTGDCTHGILSDDTLWGSGYNNHGQIGDGGTTNRPILVQIGSSTWKFIASGGSHSHGILFNNSLWGWGYNGQGQVGDGGATERLAPVQIGSSTWKIITDGGNHT